MLTSIEDKQALLDALTTGDSVKIENAYNRVLGVLCLEDGGCLP